MVNRCLLLLLITVGTSGLAARAAAGQDASEAEAGSWEFPRTLNGQPDLQGVWTNPTITPFERGTSFSYSGVQVPESAAEKAFFTEEEVAQFEALTDERRAENDGVARPDSVGSYNRHWLDSGTQLLSTRQASLVVDPPNGRVPVKEWAVTRRDDNLEYEGDDYGSMSVWDRCITRGVPGSMFPAGYNNAYRILQTPGFVVIMHEMIHDARVIPVVERPHIHDNIRLWMGDSQGHWEGNTLVVETTNFNNKGWIASSFGGARLRGIPISEALHVVERFTRVSQGTIMWEVTVDDPNVYDRPWTVSMPLTRDPGYVMFEYACHEGNWAVRNTLSGGRAEDSPSR